MSNRMHRGDHRLNVEQLGKNAVRLQACLPQAFEHDGHGRKNQRAEVSEFSIRVPDASQSGAVLALITQYGLFVFVSLLWCTEHEILFIFSSNYLSRDKSKHEL